MPGVGTTHHVKVGSIYCTLMPGGYRKRAAPLRGARVTSGDPSWSDLSVWQVWNQHCWAGGIGSRAWVDDSMYDTGVGVDTTVHEQMSLSRDLSLATAGALDANALDHEREFIVYRKPNGTKRVYCLVKPPTTAGHGSSLWRYNLTSTLWEKLTQFNTAHFATCMVQHSGELAIGFTNGKIKSTSNPDDTDSWVNRNAPKGVTEGVYAMKRYRQRLYVAYGRTIYRRKWNWKVDGKTEFYDPQDGGNIVCMEIHQGLLYMGSIGGHIHRSDGTDTNDLWSWDGSTEVVSMRSFDGRLFIGTYEFTDDDTLGLGGIYQMTGSAVTQLKRWGEMTRSTTVGKFHIYDRKLFYGASALWAMNKNSAGTDLGGFGIAVYDPIEDAHSIWASNKDTATYSDSSGTGADWMVDDILFFKGKMHAAVRGHGNFISTVTYRDYVTGTVNYDTTDTAATGSANNGFITSSIYDGGTPGLQKLWRLAQVEAFLPNASCSVELQYSINESVTWTSLGTMTGTATPAETIERWYLTTAGSEVQSPIIQWRIVLNGTATATPTVKSVSFWYLPEPEPNWVYDLTVGIAEEVVLLDGTVDSQDMDTARSTLATYFRNQTVIEFTDYDGTVTDCLIWDFVEDIHVTGVDNEPTEGFLRLSILEVAS